MASLALSGRLVTCGATTGYDAKIDLRFLFSRQLSLLGSYMGAKSELLTVMKLVAAGRFKPIVDRVFPLAEAAVAHAYLEAGSQFGKVVLKVLQKCVKTVLLSRRFLRENRKRQRWQAGKRISRYGLSDGASSAGCAARRIIAGRAESSLRNRIEFRPLRGFHPPKSAACPGNGLTLLPLRMRRFSSCTAADTSRVPRRRTGRSP